MGSVASPVTQNHNLLTWGQDVSHVACGESKFQGICNLRSKLYAAPFGSDQLLVYDVYSATVSGVDISSIARGKDKFHGICYVGDKVYAAPCRSEKLLVYDTITGDVSGVDVSHVMPGTWKFRGICAVGGTVYAAPCNSNRLLVYDTLSGIANGVKLSGIKLFEGITGDSSYFHGICAVGHRLYAAPWNSDQLLIYNTISGLVSYVDVTPIATGPAKFQGICAVGSKVYAAPGTSKYLLVYDTISEILSGIDVSHLGLGSYNGICAVGTKVYAAPSSGDQLLVFDTTTESALGQDISHVASGKFQFCGICVFEGKVFSAPLSAERMLASISVPECRRLRVNSFLAWLDLQNFVDGNTKLHLAARVGHTEGCNALVSNGANVKVRNREGLQPRDVALRFSNSEVVQYFDDLIAFSEMRSGSGDAFEMAMEDDGHVVKVAWHTIPLRGAVGRLGASHSLLAITVNAFGGSQHVYVLEKAATEENIAKFENGVYISHWMDVVTCINGEPLHVLLHEDIRAKFTMRDLRDMAVKLGKYFVATCNCHHTAQIVYNECAFEDHHVKDLPNEVLVNSAGFLTRIGFDVMSWRSPTCALGPNTGAETIPCVLPVSESILVTADTIESRCSGYQVVLGQEPGREMHVVEVLAPKLDSHEIGLQTSFDEERETETYDTAHRESCDPESSGSRDRKDESSVDAWLIDIIGEDTAVQIVWSLHAVAARMPVVGAVLDAAQSIHAKSLAKKELRLRLIELIHTVALISTRLAQLSDSSVEMQMCQGYLEDAKQALDEISSVDHVLKPETTLLRLKDINMTLRSNIGLLADLATLSSAHGDSCEVRRGSEIASDVIELGDGMTEEVRRGSEIATDVVEKSDGMIDVVETGDGTTEEVRRGFEIATDVVETGDGMTGEVVFSTSERTGLEADAADSHRSPAQSMRGQSISSEVSAPGYIPVSVEETTEPRHYAHHQQCCLMM